MMRFNSRELAFLAQDPKGRFDKEGVLQIKEKQEGLFRKGEVFVERFFKLRGNLFFYFRTKDPRSEAVGVLVLERCIVELDLQEELEHSFNIVFENDEKIVQLAARSERERDAWIEALHISSYECMKMQLESLRERLRNKTGRDPVDDPEPSVLPGDRPDSGMQASEQTPFLEMCLACDGLPKETSGVEPNTFASVYYNNPSEITWISCGRTETFEKSCNPNYFSTIGFTSIESITLSTTLRVAVYDVKEVMTNTVAQIGAAIFTIADLLTASDSRLRLRLNSPDLEDVGNLTVLAWQNDPQVGLDLQSEGASRKSHPVAKLKPAPYMSLLRVGTKRVEMLKPLYDNIITKTYRFPTNTGEELGVHEYMAESKLTFLLPKQLLKLWVEEEKMKIMQLHDLGELGHLLDIGRQNMITTSEELIDMYNWSLEALEATRGAPFKPSAKKGNKEIEFAPVNLHLQRIWVKNATTRASACYDLMTVGAFTAYPHRFKHGGLRRLLRQLKDQNALDPEGKSKLETVNQILNHLTTLKEAVEQYSGAVCRAAVQGESADLNNSMEALVDKSRQLIQVCENKLVEQAETEFCQSKLLYQQQPRPKSEGAMLNKQKHTSPEKTWKWSGTDFVKSPTGEPFDLTRLNTEAALVCVLSKVEEVLQGRHDSTSWLEEISPLIIKLKSCVEVMSARAKAGLTFLTIEECGQNVSLLHTIKYRRDVVFSQALTTATCAFMTKLRSSVTDEAFLRQIFQIGVLMQFESLLSCYGDEMGMLEDMAVGVNDLAHVSFLVESASSADDIMPTVQGNRTGYKVHVPVPESMFHLLPREIQRGHIIKIVPVLFSVGINEQQTLAEKLGDTTLQENVNIENYQRVDDYVEKFLEIVGEPAIKSRNSLPLEQLLRHLHINIVSKKNKNVEVLHLAAEICRKVDGIRCISCKSGKDRTAMGATLEQAQVLQREHDLAAHVFTHALECMRSEGVRRENTMKNTGTRKYAFNSLQLLTMPKLYRPPNGTYGNVQT